MPKQIKIRVIRGFIISSDKTAEVGEVLELDMNIAFIAIHAGQAERYVEPPAPPVAAPTPPTSEAKTLKLNAGEKPKG